MRQIRGGDAEARIKLRSPGISALLDLVTIGIYGFYWYYAVNKELAAMGRARGTEELGTSPLTSFFALMPGAFVLVPFFVSGYATGNRIKKAQEMTVGPSVSPGIGLLAMFFFFPLAVLYLQGELNKVWQSETEPEVASDAQPVA